MSEILFRNPDAVANAKERIEELTGIDLDVFLSDAFASNSAPDLALMNFERWLKATSNPALYMEQVAGRPALARRLVQVFGASQPVADLLIQNPELGALVLDPHELSRPIRRQAIEAEGRRLLTAATSYRHALDRLRFLKQRWNLPIVMNDLAGDWSQEAVWKSLSDLADALIELTADVVWGDFAAQKAIQSRPEFMVVAFGKLGGNELNYSSDVDLVYVVEDALDERVERDCMRYFEALGRALTDRMGRGSLYRVDLRLRPYGGTGAILHSMRAIEAYYRLYAEPWEVQALLRSRPIIGPEVLRHRWESLRAATCFRPALSELSLEKMLAMKGRIEEAGHEDDLKRGEGGIRNVEFLVQILQMLHGYGRPELQIRPTCEALRALEGAGFLEHSVAVALIEGYTFLRKLEHRAQLVGDRQTHRIPADDSARRGLALMMGYLNWDVAGGILDAHRRTIQTLYRSSLSLEPATSEDRSRVLSTLGPLGPAALHWFDSLPSSEGFFHGLIESEESLGRVRTVLRDAPRLVPSLKASVSLTELLMSGEILELEAVDERIKRLPLDVHENVLAEVSGHCHTALAVKWLLAPTFDLGKALTVLRDALLIHCRSRIGVEFDVLGLGSYGAMEPAPGSDMDLLFLIEDPSKQQAAEKTAERLLGLLSRLSRLGAQIQCDLRLRPEGSKGLLVRTFDGLRAYDLDGMQMWERFALGHARLVVGSGDALEVVRHCAYSLPLTPERLAELTKMKRRIETERVKPQHVHRQVKLGSGGLNDIEWLVHLTEMRHPTPTGVARSIDIDDRIKRLAIDRHINAWEADLLLEARKFLLDLRIRIYLLGLDEDLLPENPDKLDRLAGSCGLADGNLLLARHQSVTEPVRRLYSEALDRLKS